MSFLTDFFDYLSTQDSIESLVADRIYWAVAPQSKTFPQIILYVISESPESSMYGSSGLCQTRLQLDLRDTQYLRVHRLKEAVRLVTHGFKGYMGQSHVGAILPEAIVPLPPEQPFDSSERVLHRIAFDLMVWHDQARPAWQ